VYSFIEQYLRCFSNYKGTNWYKFIKLAEFSYNNAIQDSTKQSLFFLNYGYYPKYSFVIPNKVNVPRTEELTRNLNELIEELKVNLKQANETQKKLTDKYKIKPPDFRVNDKVWLDSSLILPLDNKKFNPRKLEPFKIMKKVSKVSFKLKFPKNIKIHPVVHVSSLEPYYEDSNFLHLQLL